MYDNALEELLKGSPICGLLPAILKAISDIASSCGLKILQHHMEKVTELIDSVTDCHKSINTFIVNLPVSKCLFDDIAPKKTVASQVVESEHPYRSNMDEYRLVSFPGAFKIVIVFDPTSRTENGCDFVHFLDLQKKKLEGTGTYDGRDGSENWPGVNGKPPLVLNTSEFFVYFHSDGSVEDWGYKFTATAYFPKRLTNPTKTHWMIRTDFELVDFLCSFAALLVEGPSVNLELENSLYTEWIESGSLIKSELFEGVERASEEDSFLYDLIDRPVGTLADAFANRMKAVVQEDQGTIGTINRAVYGCCAVLIKYRNLASEATALAKGLRKEPSSTLIKAWKYGQKMRSYFDLQDLRKAISSIGAMPSPESTEHIPTPRTPSSVGDSAGSSASSGRANANSKASLTIYSGADLMVLEAASRSVVERVKFLLRSTLSTSNSGFDQVMETDAEQTPEKDNVSPLKELDVLVGTGNKWKLSTKLIQMQRQVSDETQNAAEVWQALVTEAMVADKLRNMLEHRRRFAEKSQKKGVLSLTEKVLKFIQSDIEIHKLEELNSLRNKRAIYRAKGMDVFASIFKTISVPFETVIATNSYISVIQRISSRENTDSSHIANRNYHYMTGVDGCSLAQASLLSQKYSVVLTALVKLMVMSNDKFQESSKQCLQLVGQNGHDLVTTDVVTKKKEMESYERDTIAVIRACSMDYDTVDHAIIAESGLFEAISTLLSSDSKRISTVVESLLEILVARCLIVDGGKNDTLVENTDLSSKIIALLSERVQSDTRLLIGEISAEGSSDVANAHAGAFNNNDSESKSINPPFEYCMVPKTLNLRRYSTGYSHRHIDLASQHSFSLWIKRPKCEKLDSAIERLEAGATIEEIFSVGQEVVKCAEVSINHKVDGGYGSIGRVCSIIGDKDKLVVQWETTGVKENYYFSASQRDVVPADYEVGGHIFGKGAPKIVFDWTDGAPLPWSLMGLQLLPDATLLSYLSSASVPETESKNMVLLNRSKQIVKADTWTHVTVTVDRNSSLKMYINGVLDSEITMANPCSAIDKAVSTSKVFVLNSEITFPVKYFVDFTGANECVCTFSGLKDLPKNVLKIQFYDDIACERVCHAKYVRGFVSENSSLVSSITSDFFKLNKNDNTLKVFSGRFFAKIDIDSSNIKDDALAKLNIICSITGNSNSLDNVAIPQTESKTGINISKIANDIPFYLGQVPCYVMDSDNSLVSKGFNGSIARLIVHPLTAISEDVVKKYAEMSVDSESGKIVDSTNNSTTSAKFTSGNSNYLSILSMYSIIRRGLDNLENLYDTSIKRDFSNTKLLDSIFSLMGSSSSIVQAATFRMSCHIIPYLEITLVDYSAMKSGLSKGYDSFLHYLVATAGQSLNVWCKRQRAQASCAQQIQEIGQYQYDITMSKLELVRAFSAGSQDWKIFLAEFLSNGIALVKPVLKILQETVQLELDNSNEQFVQESYLYSNHNDGIFESKDDKATLIASVDLLYGMLAVLGGDYSTLYAGSVALYIDDQGMVEDCLVLGQTYPPLFDMENEKDKAKAWEKATFTSSVDDAVAIMLFSQPNVVVSAARSQLKPIESYSSYVSTKFDPNSSKVVNIHKFIKENIGTEKLMQLFTFINLATISDTRPVLRSKIEQQFVTKTFESDHPYHDSVNSYETVSFPGAESIMLEFDERCATEIDTDYVKFYRDEKHSTYYGREGGYSGRDYQRHWPGIDGVPPLIIPASSFVLNFHTDDSGNDWGYKFVASALCKRRVSPPEKPLLIHLALLSHLKMIGMKSFHATISNIPALVAPTVDIFPGILSSALASEPRSENCHFNRKQSDVVLTYESKHPYENSSDIYTPVSAPGAVRLSIVFDPETSTESGCDYVVFYTDSTHSKKVPNSDQFSGGKDGSSSNWPGVKNNPPFVVEGDSFVIYFHSDGSVNDWGYKMYVTAEFSSDMDDSRLMIRGNNMNAMTALRSCFYVQQLLLDGVGKPWEKVLMPVMPLKSLGFPIENAPEKSMAYLEYSPRFLNNSEETVNSGFTLQEEKEETSFAEEKVDESIVLTIVPNSVVASVKKVKVVKSDKIYEAPDANDVPSANPNVLGDTIVDEVYIVRKEILDWVLVQRAPVVTAVLPRVIDVFSLFDEGEEESPLKSDNGSDDNSNSSKPVNTADDGGDSGAWLRRRADDNIYLQSVVEDKESAAATSDPKQTTNPIDKKDDKKKNKAEKNKATREALTRHPMYSINDMEKVIRDQITINDSSVDSIQLLRSELNTLETSLYEYSVIAANGYAYECLGIIIDNWHEAEKPFNMHYFETTSNLLTYLHKSIIDSNINNNTDGITKHERFFKFLSSILLESTDQRTSKVLSTNSFGTLVDAALQVGCDLIDFAKQELVRATVCEDVSMSTVQLGYWLLKSFVSTRSPNVNQFLLNLDTFSILRKFFDSDISINMRSEILLLFINFIQQLSETNQASEELIEELHALNSSLIFTAQIQYIKDTRNGQEMLYITQYLQAIIEVALSTQDTIGKLINTRASKVSTQSPLVGRSKEVFIETEFTRAGMKTFHAVNDSSVLKQKYFSQVVESCTAFGLFRANFLIKELSSNDHPCFGILIDSNKGSYKFDCNFQLGFRSNEISLCNGRLINGNESIECNCIIRKGDILTIEVDLTKSLSVTYYKNGVMVVDAVGLTGSQALLQMNKVPDISLEVSIIISIANDEDVIQLVPDVFSPKPRSLVDNTTLTASAIDQDSVESLPEWLQPVRDAYLMLKSLEGNEIPKYILDNKFMPFCRQMSTVPALLSFDDSNEGLSQSAKVSKGDNSIKTEISIEGATRISIVVGHLKVRDCDTLEIYNKENVLIMKVSGKQSISVYGSLNEYFQDVHKEVKYPNGDVLTNRAGVKIALGSGGGKSNYYCGRNLGRKQIPHSDGCCGPSNGPQCKDCKGFTESKPPVLKVPKATKDGDSAVEFASDFNNLQLDIHVGDVVVRGPDWSYGNEDGGAGEVGEVLSIQSWQGVPSVGVQVRWRENKFTSVYRYGLDGAYDLSIFLPIAGESRHFISESIIRKLPDRGVVHIPGSALTMILRKGAEELATNEIEQIFFPKAFCWCVPSYRLSDVMSIPKFQPFLTHLRSLFVSQFLSGDIALVNHINNYARTKNISLTELFRKKWVELAPSSEDLTRSPALKNLNSLQAVEMPTTTPEEPAVILEDGKIIHTEEINLAIDDSFIPDTRELLLNSSTGIEPVDSKLRGPYNNYCLQDYAYWAGIYSFETIDEAIEAATQIYPECGGITLEASNEYTLRRGTELIASDNGETSWILKDPFGSDAPVETQRSDQENTESSAVVSALSTENDVEVPRVMLVDTVGFDDSATNTVPVVLTNHTQEESKEGDGGDNSDGGGDGDDDDEEREQNSEESFFCEFNLFDNSDEDSDENSCRNHNDSNNNSKLVCAKCKKGLSLKPPNTWNNGWICDWSEHKGPNSFRGSDQFYGCATAVRCDWGICVTCYNKSAGSVQEDIVVENDLLGHKDHKPINAHFTIIQLLNLALAKALPFIDLSQEKKVPGSLAYLLCKYRGLIFDLIKNEPFNRSLSATSTSSCQFDLLLSRPRARKFAQSGQTDHDAKYTVFAQAFRVIHPMDPKGLRRDGQLYNTKFMGEYAQDAGGPYRESFAMYTQELQSTVLPLLIPTPNGKHAVGYNREKWVINPSATSSTCMEMYKFLGKLMGIALRSKEYLALDLPSITWKLLVNDEPTIEDLELIDYSFVKSIEMLRTIDTKGIDATIFSETFFETFTTNTSDDRVVELVPKGHCIDVTFENRENYCDLVVQYRLHEFDKQAAAIREGLATIIPIHMLSLYTWNQLEEMVCGCPEIDVQLLKQMTEYSSCSASDPHIVNFWKVVSEEFTNEERSALIRFTWGRSRLPLTANSNSQKFKLQNFDRSPADSYYPVAHTCFFSLELPRYSTLEIMRDKLRYAIFNCSAIDGDDTSTGMAVAAMGWED